MTLSTTALAQYDAPKLAAALERAQERIHQLEQEKAHSALSYAGLTGS